MIFAELLQYSMNDGRSSVTPFVAGAVTASLLWYALQWWNDLVSPQSFLDHHDDDDNNDISSFQSLVPTPYIFFDDWKSRIGELPRRIRRTRWPWQTMRAKSQSDEEEEEEDNLSASTLSNNNNPQSAEESESLNDDGKSGFCIGSIFGLDVGGTLAKLVYFEEVKPEQTENAPRAQHSRTYTYDGAGVTMTQSLADLGALHALSPDRLPRLPEDDRADTDSDNLPHAELRRTHSAEFPSATATSSQLAPDSPEISLEVGTSTTAATTQVNGDTHLPLNDTTTTTTTQSTAKSLPKIHSYLDLQFTNRDYRREALERFYNFAQHLDFRDHQLRFYSRELGGYFHFVHFETRRMDLAIDLIRKHNLQRNIRQMGATGGGAHKFAADFEQALGITMKREGELESLVAGMQFVLSTVVGECYSFRPPNEKKKPDRQRPPAVVTQLRTGPETEDEHDYGDYFGVNNWTTDHGHENGDDLNDEEKNGKPVIPSSSSHSQDPDATPASPEPKPKPSMKIDDWWWSRKVQRDAISYSSTYPYLVVTIGTGVSILRVDGPRKHERISGSTIGGGTYWGLIRLLTSYEQFEDVIRLAERGDPSKVDMMVGDIYGGNSDALDRLGLRADLVASSFGKLVAKEDPAEGLTEEDLARALLLMVTNNIGQVAYLNAELHNTERIYFVGNFLRQNRLSQRRLAFAIDYWSKGKMEALFLEHEGYFGALGAFLLSQGIPHQESHRKILQSQRSTPLPAEVTPPRPPLRRRQTFETYSFASSD